MTIKELNDEKLVMQGIIEAMNEAIVTSDSFRALRKGTAAQKVLRTKLFEKDNDTVNFAGFNFSKNEDADLVIEATKTNDILLDLVSTIESGNEKAPLAEIAEFLETIEDSEKEAHFEAISAYAEVVMAFEAVKTEKLEAVKAVLAENTEAVKTLAKNMPQILADAIIAILEDAEVDADTLAGLDFVLYYTENNVKTGSRTVSNSTNITKGANQADKAEARKAVKIENCSLIVVGGTEYVMDSHGNPTAQFSRFALATGKEIKDFSADGGVYSCDGIGSGTRKEFQKLVIAYANENEITPADTAAILSTDDFFAGSGSAKFTPVSK